MRGEILTKILEFLYTEVITQANFITAVLASGYGASMGKIDFEYRKRQRISENNKWHVKEQNKRIKRLKIFLAKMKHDGLIEKTNKNNEIKIKISEKGKKKLKYLKNRLPYRKYSKEKQRAVVIISFDIPERLRKKRRWLREVIKNLGFEMIHQSLWTGKVKIPKEFILDLENLKILEYVEIFQISKTGTLKKF
ncbi:hypothetical protein A3D42_02820 [Candidatus Nomurabacteria bacterium RIFCSPHIGHO2_02_FULL_41_18]|uniref:Transcriptional repressor PaaX-like central Cas2-like domain-containing protein n=1 Tax=Candidatus Nomurabacteria bacterium RIFCSPHIGHO2_02_FULL_41_18 TaxID=1801754 RepID=A0A1F6W734_9BACT|nr:MAG: hypothetical protein A2737_02885 [Candidatus Nomurabacteria bacterium RIFCSPHIGHO2_01_FULL_41_71]OGI77719.1 MAG: hypothetical protein A3D42_02820 [Candidatus Nomurabacteria bacterium RIFCSPHIGHO2_02_FULL_41_18]OGI89953.1 MAG: hypothetical protein A3B01_01790 [Candidatus Nomurabacteria bacterium RIFCSPLOWO2_01_FULL_41_52b]OGJ00453.1 MAG: hypothetical protein A3I90_01095 [Candidatus Nomurabacteria bacterium RIFCSPLOWO2_02_FULL_41_9]